MTRHRIGRALLWVALSISATVLIAGPPAGAADLKIGYIDSDRIFDQYAKTREVQQSFNRDVEELSKTARSKKTEIDELQRKLDQQSPMLSEAKRDELNLALQKKISEYEAFVQSNWGPSGHIAKLNEEYLKPIIDRVHNIVTVFGTEDGYSLILDAADGNVVFGSKEYDLTERVLTALKAEDDSGTPTRATRSGTGN